MTSEPDIFIIESLKLEDEKEELFEGDILRRVLRLSGKDPMYRYMYRPSGICSG